MKRILTTCLLALLPALAAAGPPRIVVSLPPLHALVAGVIEGSGAQAHLLLRGGASPHTFALTPADARALAAADLVVAADPALEGFLEKPLASLAAGAGVVWLTRVDGVRPVRTRAGGAWNEDTDPGHDDHGHGERGSIDPHAWLDPRNAIALTRALAARLAALDPTHAARYRANAARRVEALAALDGELAQRLAPVQGRPYLVFHDGYHYLEHRYGLTPVGALAVHPGRPPGARRLAAIHDRIEATGARCLFAEPQFEPRIVRVIAQATGIRTATLDPLGAGLEPGPGLYEQLMRQLAADLVGCLEG